MEAPETEMVYNTPSEPVNYQGVMAGGMGPPVQQGLTSIDWAALNKQLLEQAKRQNPFESEWHRLLKQSQVQQKASKKVPALEPPPGKTRDIDAALDAFHGICEKKRQQDHIWNMIVLAAESSRHST